jgi:hypothetical protein
MASFDPWASPTTVFWGVFCTYPTRPNSIALACVCFLKTTPLRTQLTRLYGYLGLCQILQISPIGTFNDAKDQAKLIVFHAIHTAIQDIFKSQEKEKCMINDCRRGYLRP